MASALTSRVVLALAVGAACWHPLVHAETRAAIGVGRVAVSGETTLDQAKHEALSQARTRAVEQAAGVTVSSVAMLQDNLIVGEMVKTFAHGFIVAERATAWNGSWSNSGGKELGYPVVEVRLDALVDVKPRHFVRDDLIDAELDRQTYRDGEPAKITVQARQDMRVLVVNYTSQSSIVPVFPQSKQSDNVVLKGAHREMPSADDPVEWEIVLRSYPGHARDVEAFLVFGFPNDEHMARVAWGELFPAGQEMPYAQFFERLLSLPVQWMAQKTMVYTVVSR